MPYLDFSKIEELVNTSTTFSLSERQYKELTGKPLPKDRSYLEKRSALARFANNHGLKIIVQERTISFEGKI